jgi:uncharacterized membrane protein YfcA
MPPELLAAGAAVLFAYLVRGVSGFGSALLAVPLLAHLYPLTLVVPLMVVLDFFAALALTAVGQRAGHVDWREVAVLIPGTLIGVVVGLWVLLNIAADWLLLALALFVIFFGLRFLAGAHGGRSVSRRWAVPAGFVGGAVGSVFATGGPPYVIYLGHRVAAKQVLRATLSAVFLIDGAIRLVGMTAGGLLSRADLAPLLAVGSVAMVAGLAIGHRLHVGLSERQMAVVVGGLLVASGGSLLWRWLG